MTSEIPHLPEELEKALEDVRQVRMTVDRLRRSHPIRDALKPLSHYAFVLGPIFVVYGVGMQWLRDSSVQQVWGIPKAGFIALLTFLLMMLMGFAKSTVYKRALRHKNVDANEMLKQIMVSSGYLRIIAGTVPMFVVLCLVFVQMGHSHQIVGLVGLFSGSVYILIPLALPMKEISWLGALITIASGISMFIFPAYPFYKVAVLFGGLSLGFGVIGFSSLEETERQDESD